MASLSTILSAFDAAVARSSARAVGRAVGLSPTRVIQIVEEHRANRVPKLYAPTLQRLEGWYERSYKLGEPRLPKLSPETSRELKRIAARLDEILDRDGLVLVGSHPVSAREVARAIRRLGGN